MQARRKKVFLSLPIPKIPPKDLGFSNVPNICAACGLVMVDANHGLCMFLLPCGHAYHAYCFAHLSMRKDICMAMGCMQVILPASKSLVIPSHHTNAPAHASKVPFMLPYSGGKSFFSHGMYHTFMHLNPCLHYYYFLFTW